MKTRSKTAKQKCSKRALALSRQAERANREATLLAICNHIKEEVCNNEGNMPYGLVTRLAAEWSETFPWITRNVVNKRYMRFRREGEGAPQGMTVAVDGSSNNLEIGSNVSTLSGSIAKKPGRPKGTTDQRKEDEKQALIDATNEIAEEYNEHRIAAIKSNCKVKKGTLDKIIAKKKRERKIKADIKPQTICRRIIRGVLHHRHRGGHISPLEEIESIAVTIMVQKARIRQPLTPSKGLSLINDLIEGTEYQDRLVKWKRKFTVNAVNSVGRGYWYSFMKRNRNKISSKRGQKYELDRQNWTTYANFADMYDHCVIEMEQAGVAKKLDEPTWMTKEGQECDPENAFGCKVTHQIVRPDMCLCGDEVGGNICMAGDGHVGGELFLSAKGTVPQNKTSKVNKKFTLIGLTAFTGDPVLCIIILQGKQRRADIESGIDILVPPVGKTSDPDFYRNNFGPGKYLPGGPVCHYNGKDIPAMIRWHESGSVTSEILVDALKTLDHLQVFSRDDGVSPFLMLDGHSSRLRTPFLKYINTPEDHYVTCIGVPYGTALWQVGDSKEQNGSFNMAMTSEKRKLVRKKEQMSLPGKLVATDLIPLINKAWLKSFARKDKNKIAIAERGWNPYNRCLLLDATIRATMTAGEKLSESLGNLMPPNIQDYIDGATNTSQTHPMTDASHSDSATRKSQSTFDCDLSKKLNFSSTTTAFCVDALVQTEDLMKSRERIKDEQAKGKELREQLQSVKKLTAGKLFKAGTTRLGSTLLQVHEENLLKQGIKDAERLKKEAEKYEEMVIKAKEIMDRNVPFDKLKVSEMKIVLAPLKRQGDKWPTKRKDLIELYPKVKDRPPKVFEKVNVDGLIDTDTGNNENIIDNDNYSDSETETDINNNSFAQI